MFLHTQNSESEIEDHLVDHSSIPLPEVDYDKDIISITTDSSYISTSEFHDFSSTKPLTTSAVESFTNVSPHYSLATPDAISSTTSDATDYFGDLFGFLFKDEDDPMLSQKVEDVTIPPFRNISSVVSLHDILNITDAKVETTTNKESTSKTTIPIVPKKNTKHPSKNKTASFLTTSKPNVKVSTTTIMIPTSTTTTTTPEPPPNLDILRDALLSSLSNADLHPIHPVRHPIYQSSVPFLSPIFQAKPELVETKHTEYNPIRSDLDLILPGLHHTDTNKNHPTSFDPFHVEQKLHHLQPVALPEYSSAPSRKPYPAVDTSAVKTFEGAAQIFTKPAPSVGLLKLAGCNIYGRMYRVGRIIAELSSACLECRCTEVGVHCTPLEC